AQGEPASFRREPRRSIEVMSAREHVSGPAAWAEIDGDDGIDRLAVAGVILAHADPAAAARVDHAVRETPLPTSRRLGRERARLAHAFHLRVEAAVREIGEIDGAVVHGP